MRKTCTKCLIEKDLNEFGTNNVSIGSRKSWCRDCCIEYARKYYKDNKEKFLDGQKEYRKNNKDIVNKTNREYNNRHKDRVSSWMRNRSKKLRVSFLEVYGNRCSCCGETEEVFLTIDHIKGQVGKKKESSEVAYRKAIKEYHPDLYRVLCMNCNSAVRFDRICPHQIGKQ